VKPTLSVQNTIANLAFAYSKALRIMPCLVWMIPAVAMVMETATLIRRLVRYVHAGILLSFIVVNKYSFLVLPLLRRSQKAVAMARSKPVKSAMMAIILTTMDAIMIANFR
jgi:hypothetical protein